ncbi:C-type lectin domain family 2 member B-like [Mauremys reevesii]|uniref:C-type lectin domain family 2 member B-like n=1 Tax=Mauremys reevesii TaxID=260615 RepID=UPI00193F7153|nr:C-type lectin domain family 2 member B-like [Mauremys reevesii]
MSRQWLEVEARPIHTGNKPVSISGFYPLPCWRGIVRHPLQATWVQEIKEGEGRSNPEHLPSSSIRSRASLCLHLWFWRRVAGILIAVPVILLLIWFSWSSPILPHLELCRDDWLYYRKKCYYLSEDQADWDSSQRFCSAHGASLAMIESQQEMNFIMNRMRTRDSWIGLRKKGAKFYWVNGETLNTSLFPVYLSGHEECAHTDSISISTSECRLLRNWLCSVGLPSSSTLSP